jgi:hypothetical protein
MEKVRQEVNPLSKDDREVRLAEALRANLRRRKAQARAAEAPAQEGIGVAPGPARSDAER